ncbi:hypothetical protein [Halococcus sediminicola]|uniref:hypothetical protein n=1 Tax=Halococcus sediminicola TaxID=1264579 RepID=UPI000A8AF4C6|nr:hypothetical protein [Halococcus sediminicola]
MGAAVDGLECVESVPRPMDEPSDTTPNPGRETERATCENCGARLDPLEWETLDDDAEANEDLHFCDEECIEEWQAEQ